MEGAEREGTREEGQGAGSKGQGTAAAQTEGHISGCGTTPPTPVSSAVKKTATTTSFLSMLPKGN